NRGRHAGQGSRRDKDLAEMSNGRWTRRHADALRTLAQRSAAGERAVQARSSVVRTLALLLLDLQTHIAELEAQLAALLEQDEASQRLQHIPGIGPQNAATLRAEL